MEIRMSKKWLIALASTVLFAPMSWALGLGEIEIKSKLNQPLDAEIEITSATNSELNSVVFSIPNADVFARYNLDRPIILGSVRFVVDDRGTSNKVIRLSSTQVVKDPFLTFLVQADWPQGRMLREYTVLVDPPLFVPSQSEVQTNAYVEGASVNTRDNNSAQGSISGRTDSVSTGNATGNFDYSNFSSSESTDDNYRVKRGDTLWEIANSLIPDESFTVNQTMMAIFRSNPEAFEGNINRLKAGQILSVPTRNQINALTAQTANQAVRSQTKDWRDNTGDYGSSTSNNAASTDSVASSVQTADSTESNEGRLELKVPDLSSEVSEDGLDIDLEGLGGNEADAQLVGELQAKVDEFERLLSAKDNELASLQQELARARDQENSELEITDSLEPSTNEFEGESNSTEEPSESELSAEVETPATDTPVIEEPAIEEPAIEEPAIEEPVKTQTPVISATEDGGGLFNLLKKIAIGLGLALLGLFGFLFFKNRNKGPSHDTLFVDEDLDTQVEDIAEAVKTKIGNKYSGTSEVETLKDPALSLDFDKSEASADIDEDFNFGSDTETETASEGAITETIESNEALPFDDTTLADVSMATMDVDTNDPIAETDFHMAYGLYDQAADIMSSAIIDTGNYEFKEKLLEVFFVSGNKEEFIRFATELKDESQASHASSWENIIIMGKQIAPENELFSGDVSTAGIDEGLDFSLDETGQIEVDQSLFSDMEEFAESKVTAEASTDEVVDLDFSEAANIDTDLVSLDFSDKSPVETVDDDVLDISLSLELPEAPVDLEGVIEDFGSDLDATLNTSQDTILQKKIDEMPATDATREVNVEEFLDLDIGSNTGISELPDFDLSGHEQESSDLANAEDSSDETLDFSFDLNSSDDLPVDNLNLDVSEETQNLADEFLENLDNSDTRTQEMKMDENFDLLLGGNDETSASELDLDLETLLSEDMDPFPDDTKRSMLPDGVNEADTGTMSLNALNEDNVPSMQEIEDILNPDDLHASTSQITDDELAAMGLSDKGPELMGVTGMSFGETEKVDEVSTKLDLARAYIEMDDPDNAKSILQEVLDEGDSSQQNEAKNIMATLS